MRTRWDNPSRRMPGFRRRGKRLPEGNWHYQQRHRRLQEPCRFTGGRVNPAGQDQEYGGQDLLLGAACPVLSDLCMESH